MEGELRFKKDKCSQVGFIISPVTPDNSGQYWCTAQYKGKTSEYGISLMVLMETR